MTKVPRLDRNTLLKWLIIAAVGVFVVLKGAIYHTDTTAFLNMGYNRSPLYSSFLKLYTSIFGSAFEMPIVISQYIIIVVSASHLLKTFKTVLKLSFFGQIILLLMLLAPYIHWHFTANKLMSEALTYPLVLILTSFTIRYFISTQKRHLKQALITLMILLLARGQFIVMVPVLLLVVIYVNWKKRDFRTLWFSVLLVVLIPIFSGLIERGYHKIVHDHFVGYGMTWIHAITADFYVANEEDVNLFEEVEYQEYFETVYASLKNEELTRNQVLYNGLDDQFQYQKHFSAICNERIHEIGLAQFGDALDLVEKNLALNSMCRRMLFPLLAKNIQARTGLFYKNLKTTFGSAKYMILFLLLFIFSVVRLFRTNDPLYKFTTFVLLFMFANNMLIAFVVHPTNRYTFYFDWVIFAIVLLFLDRITKKSVHAN